MGKVFVTSDWHLNHLQLFIWQARGFNSVEEMNSELIRRHNKLVTADDDVYGYRFNCQSKPYRTI